DICIFGIRRGSGESIWDIKKRMGFVSPELLQYYDTSVTFREVVASGFFHSIGLHKTLSAGQNKMVEEWIRCFNMTGIAEKPLHTLHKEIQYWALFIRALVNNPDLLIFDEPFQ